MAGFMREAGNNPAWSYEGISTYSMEYVTDHGPMCGWMAVTMNGERIAYFADHALATSFHDLMNRAAYLPIRKKKED